MTILKFDTNLYFMRRKINCTCGNEHKDTMSKTCSQTCQNKYNENLKKANKEKGVARKKRITEKKRFSRSNLVKEADRVSSLYVRERDKGKPCITC